MKRYNYCCLSINTVEMQRHVPFPNVDSGRFNKVIPEFLSNEEVALFAERACFEADDEAYFCPGLCRAFFVDTDLAANFKKRIEKYVDLGNFVVNDHFRLSNYKPGSFMALHEDRANRVDISGKIYRSFLTVNIFLNDNNGGTSFWNQMSHGIVHNFTVPAVAGTACIFDARELHRGEVVGPDRKFLLRTDVLIPE